jgi:hypothetical protein
VPTVFLCAKRRSLQDRKAPLLGADEVNNYFERVTRRKKDRSVITRREALTAAAIGGGCILGASTRAAAPEPSLPTAKVCVLTPEATEGPFYFDPKLARSDITEEKPGASLLLTLQIVEAKDCAPVPWARVDVWHADGLGKRNCAIFGFYCELAFAIRMALRSFLFMN